MRRVWRSPLRGPWLTAALGTVLLPLLAIVAVTGLLSHAAYEPDLRGNAIVPVDADLPLNFDWPTSPTWLYALTQTLHVAVGLVAVPFLLVKLWSVIPRLFVWPPVSSPAQAVERAGVGLLVASTIFQFATGIVNVQYWYVFDFNFVVAHYYGGVVFTASLTLHVLVKAPVIVRAYRRRERLLSDLVATDPDPPTISRRGLFALAGGASLLLLVAGGPLRRLAFLGPRPERFPVNTTAASAKVTAAMVGPAYRLTLSGGRALELSRDDLLALPQHTARLPIACVEGWTTTQTWTGVRLSELARLAGVPEPDTAFVRSLQPAGVLSKASLSADGVAAGLLALKVNGADLPLDHGFPARIIVPALPGVHNTKWVAAIEFGSAA